MHFIGVDIGGTKISVCLGDENGKVKNSCRCKTASLKDSTKGIVEIDSMIDTLLKEAALNRDQIDAIGLSCPGPISHKEGKILNPPNLEGWENTPIVSIFEKKYNKPVFMNNDANSAAIAEWEFGSAKHTPNLVYLTLSTGLGGGIIIDNKLLQGNADVAGEVGHYILDPDGPVCFCGQKGCFEAFCSGRNIAKNAQDEIRKKDISTIILQEAGGDIEKIDMICIIEAMKKQDPFALTIWENFIEHLAQGIGILLMTLNPDAIILGTIAIHTKSLLLEPLKEKLPRFAWKLAIDNCKIEPSILGSGISELSSLALAINGMRAKAK